MIITGIRFKDAGRIYYFDPAGLRLKLGMAVIVETIRGIELGFVAMDNKNANINFLHRIGFMLYCKR